MVTVIKENAILLTRIYVKDNNSASQLDELDTICIMKKIGFSLDEIKEHMQHYTMDSSVSVLRKQLTSMEQQMHELEVIKSRIEHRCIQLEHSASISKDSTKITITHEKVQYLMIQKVDPPYTLESVSLATKKCFVRSLKEKLPVFFQS